VSRPTLRQAARILEREQLITVRRGANGGLFSQRPTSQAVADMASVYLRSVRTTVRDVVHMHGTLSREAIQFAARNPSAQERARLLDWVEATEADERVRDPRRFSELSIEFGRVLGSITASPTLALFTDVIATLAMAPVSIRSRLFEDPHRIETTRAYQLELGRAIRDGDAERALAAQRCQQAVALGWIQPDGLSAEFGPSPQD
jgi:DNA-binding FadR family transcriptional regulator